MNRLLFGSVYGKYGIVGYLKPNAVYSNDF